MRSLVLHGVRLKGLAEPATLAALWEIDEGEVEVQLKSLSDDGLVQRRDGRLSGWSLTNEGTAADDSQLQEELDSTGARPAIEDAYRRFCGLNRELLEVCTAWQLVDGAINDHADAAYDTAVIDRLAALHAEVEPALADLAAALPRFARYPVRLDDALGKIRGGDADWFTKPLLDSYHTVWFELHEDLLSTLGRQRGAEGA